MPLKHPKGDETFGHVLDTARDIALGRHPDLTFLVSPRGLSKDEARLLDLTIAASPTKTS